MKKERMVREEILPASFEDINQILILAKPFVDKGLILKRSRKKVEKMIKRKELRVAIIEDPLGKEGRKVQGFCACSLLSPQKAELHFLVAKRGNPFVAVRLIKSWLEILEKLGIELVFLTTRIDNRMKETVFKRCGFEPISIWKLSLRKLIPLLWRRILGRHSIAMGRYLNK